MTETQDSRTQTPDAPEAASPPREGRAAAVVVGVGALAALVAVLAALYDSTGMADGLDQTGVVILALNLFSPIMVAMLAGAAGGSLASRFGGPRVPLAAAGIAAVGLATGGAAYALFRVDASIALGLSLILLGAALVGGLPAFTRHRLPLTAGLIGTLLLLVVLFTRGVLSSSLTLFADPLDQFGAMARIVPFVGGLACGFAAFVYLRAARAGTRLPGYLFAGAIPGAIWLLSTVIAQVGVEVLLALGVDQLAVADTANFALTFQAQYNGSMTALFAGALCSVLAYGLLLPKASKRS